MSKHTNSLNSLQECLYGRRQGIHVGGDVIQGLSVFTLLHGCTEVVFDGCEQLCTLGDDSLASLQRWKGGGREMGGRRKHERGSKSSPAEVYGVIITYTYFNFTVKTTT